MQHAGFPVGSQPSSTTASPTPAGGDTCGRRGSQRPAPRRPTLPRGYLPRPAGAPPGTRARAHTHTRTHSHSPIFPLGFVDVTISASANFAALVFKQVLDPLPLAAQLHFKVIVHCHSLRGRRAGSGGRGPGWGPGKHGQPQAPGNPPALRPPAAAPARRMRQQQEEAARERRGHPGGQRGRGRPGWGGSPRAKESRGTTAGGGERVSLPLSPRAPRAPAPLLSPAARVLLPLRWERRGGRGGLCFSHTRTHASPSLSHTHTLTLTHSLTLPYTPTERQRRTTAGTSSERGGGRAPAEHGRGCRKSVAKPGAASGPDSSRLPRRLAVPAGARTPRALRKGAGEPLPKAAAKRTTWMGARGGPAPDYNAQNAWAAAVPPLYGSTPHVVLLESELNQNWTQEAHVRGKLKNITLIFCVSSELRRLKNIIFIGRMLFVNSALAATGDTRGGTSPIRGRAVVSTYRHSLET
ncbi:collagen alpha-1(I) chain-like [Oryctolagus cuniculus]|uniref:collagen alpha-1(I) chain-like n=1 Tax=Oryctolagus cuniculus TaxID=9986 RepID=UPI00387A176C